MTRARRSFTRIAVVACLLCAAVVAVSWLSGLRDRSAGRQHGTPDHWPPVARKPAA